MSSIWLAPRSATKRERPFSAQKCLGRRRSARVCALERTWSNPEGLVLKQLQRSLFVAERPFVWNGIDVGGKMAVCRLINGDLWVHSPVNLTADLRLELSKHGPVKHIVSPNYEHLKYANQWIEAYPDARSYGCPGLKARHPEILCSDTVGENNSTPPGWPEEIEVTHLNYEHNPFTKTTFFSEVIFCHVPSATLLTTDLFWNYPDEAPPGTKLWKFGMDQIYHPFYGTFMIKDRGEFKAAMDRILGQRWENILPCHGSYVAKHGKRTLRSFLGL